VICVLARSYHDHLARPAEMRVQMAGYPRSRLISVMSRMTSSSAQPANSMMDPGGREISPPQPVIYMEIHFLVDIRIIPEPDEAAPAKTTLGLEEGNPWWRRGVKSSQDAPLDLLEIGFPAKDQS
jgi:hypothetical protein